VNAAQNQNQSFGGFRVFSYKNRNDLLLMLTVVLSFDDVACFDLEWGNKVKCSFLGWEVASYAV